MKQRIIYFLILINSSLLIAQENYFTQYNISKTLINPAFTGTDSALNLSSGYRFSSSSFGLLNKTFYFSTDKYFRSLRSGLGISLINNKQLNNTSTGSRIDLNYATHLEFFKHRLVIQPAIQLSYFTQHLSISRLTFGDMIDPRRGFEYSNNDVEYYTIEGLDLSAGLLLYTNRFYGGISINHITEPKLEEIDFKLPVKTIIHGGVNFISSDKKITFSPNVLFITQNNFNILQTGITVKYKMFVCGISNRLGRDAVIMNLGFQCRFLKIGYSYDYNPHRLFNIATHEIQLAWFIKSSKKTCKIKTLRLI
jgi:type IX secretion system PorP/SprF family membrane protein